MSNGGMRRILKHPPSAVQWIRNKYNKNLYDKYDTSIPIAHEIFSLNPPLSSLQYTIPKDDEEMKKIYLPTEKAIRGYVQRHDLKKQSQQTQDEALKEEERMAKILGIDRKSAVGNKSVVLANAYQFAIRQLEVQKQHPDYSEDEAVAAVEEILKMEDKAERITSREITNTIATEAAARQKELDREAVIHAAEGESDATSSSDSASQINMNTIPSILHGDTQTIMQLTVWGERLQQVPYDRWTLGAATALDHWIATKILKLKEETWEDLLQGKEEKGMSRGRDIIAVRKSLFPETTMESTPSGSLAFDDEDDSTDKRIDDLLASLKFDVDDEDDKWADDEDDIIGEDEQYQAKLETMLETLQSWRERNVQTPYDKWDAVAKKDFNTFLEGYVAHLSPESELEQIDMESTRDQLLSQPPMTRDASNSFFSNLVDETEAEIFLDKLRSSPISNDQYGPIYKSFMALPHDEQLARLIAIGTLRPLYDEYTTEKDRMKFLADHEDILLRGVPLESFVEDKKGIIALEEVEDKDARFRVEKVRYGEANAEREDMILDAWGTYKSAKATYEEKLFQEGKLGLEYKKSDKNKKEEK